MAKNMAMNENINNQIHQFQVIYMSNPGLNINKASIGNIGSNMDLTFDYITIFTTRKLLIK